MTCVIFPVCYFAFTKMDKFQSVYYELSHLWKGQKAIKKLRELCNKTPKVIKQELLRGAIWQIHLTPLKCVDRPHYEVRIPNEVHQFDLLYMPSDMLCGNKYK